MPPQHQIHSRIVNGTCGHITSEGILWTDLYSKPTDSHTYLHYRSAHPRHNKKSLPYSQFLRLKRICTKEKDFIHHSQMISFHFVRRGYPKRLIQSEFLRVCQLNRRDLLTQQFVKRKTDDETVFLITTFNPGFNDVRDLIKKNWGILTRSSTTKGLSELRVIHGYRRPPSIRDILVHSRLKIPHESSKGISGSTFRDCTDPTCCYCPRSNTTGFITSPTTGSTFQCCSDFTCHSSNVIYCLKCTHCNKLYVFSDFFCSKRELFSSSFYERKLTLYVKCVTLLFHTSRNIMFDN